MTNTILATITAYCLCNHCCPTSSHGLNAAGKRPVANRSIAASRSIPLGSRVLIQSHTYIVDDRLARRYDHRFDIFMSSHRQALNFGIKTNTVTIITP